MKTSTPQSPALVILPLILGLGLLTVAGSGCHQGGQAASMMPPPPQVTVAPVEQREIVEWDEFTGRTEAVESVEVRPRVSGHIQEIRFQSGQLVKKGEVLFVIDPRWHQAEFDKRQADWQQAKVRQENAEREAARTATLLERKAISTEEAEQRQARFSEARAGLLAAEAGRSFAKLDLENTEVRSPIDGRVSRAFITVGNYVSGLPGGASLLTTLVSLDPIYVYADIDENSLLKFNALARSGRVSRNAEGKVPVELQLADEQGFPHQGVLESFDNRINAQSGSILLRALFANPDGHLLPGLFAHIRLPGGAKTPALLIEETAIGTDQAQKFVLTVSPTNTTVYRPVKLGSQVEGKRVVREGLQPGDKVIVNGLARVRPGMRVVPQEAVPTNAPAKVAQR